MKSHTDEQHRAALLQLSARVEAVIGLAARFGRSAEGGRIGAYVRRVRPVIDAWLEDPNTRHAGDAGFLHAYVELGPLHHIANTLEILIERSPELDVRVNRLVEDSFYSERGRETAGKDTQVELAVGAFLEWAGASPVWRPIGPDWRVILGGSELLIEVKRIRDTSGIDSAVRQGVKQLRKYGPRGALWLDLSDIFAPAAHSWKVYQGADCAQELLPSFAALVERISPTIERRLDRTVVDALIFHATCAVQYCPSFDFLASQMHAQGLRVEGPADVSEFRRSLDARECLPIIGFGACDLLYYWLLCVDERLPLVRDLVERLRVTTRNLAVPS